MEQLATRCPNCQTQFRVTMAQLELREGKVRCGSCREIFNGVEHVFEHGGSEDFTLSPPPAQQDMSDRMTLIDFGSLRGMPPAASGPSMQDELDALSRAIADLQSKPWTEPPASPRSEFADDDQDDVQGEEVNDADRTRLLRSAPDAEPVFVQLARRRQRGRRVWKVLLWVGIPLLILALGAQLTFHFRHELAARFPEVAPTLRAACAELGCTIRLPKEIDKLSLVSSRLDAIGSRIERTGSDGDNSDEPGPPNRFVLVALLRNQADTVQAWPSLDLQLKDDEGKALLRRAFLPSQYVPADELVAGMPARSEREIHIPFELAGAPPAGFEVTIFHH